METLQRCRRCHLPRHWAVRCRPAFGGHFQVPQTSTQTRREKSMADTENTLILETTQGAVTIEMRPDLAPGHVARIKELVREGFYDGIVFHRVIEGFMAQTGCPHGTGTGGSGKKLKAEFNKEPHVARHHLDGPRRAARIPATASSSSASTMPPSSTASTRSGARSRQAWRTSTRSSAASRCRTPTRSSRRTWPSTRPELTPSFRGASKMRTRNLKIRVHASRAPE